MRRLLPAGWREKIEHTHFVEVVIVLLGLGSGLFGVIVITTAPELRAVRSFQQAFAFADPQAWGLVMVILSVLMIALLSKRRAIAAIPTFLLGGVWTLWSVPIFLSPGFVPTAPIIYSLVSAITLAAGFFCLFEREG